MILYLGDKLMLVSSKIEPHVLALSSVLNPTDENERRVFLNFGIEMLCLADIEGKDLNKTYERVVNMLKADYGT